jgi:hypothetical protein
MIVPGKQIVSLEFDEAGNVDKQWVSFRKETTYKVVHGQLHVIPPAVANKGIERESDWATSDFSRVGLIGLPRDYICTARWKYIKPTDTKLLEKSLVYIDLGHRSIRTTFSKTGTTLLLENHLVGRDKEDSSIILQEMPQLKLEPDKWYDIIAEVKGNEVVIQIDDQVLYGKHELIAGDRYDTFNFDSMGVGFLVDKLEIRAAGDYQVDWKSRIER